MKPKKLVLITAFDLFACVLICAALCLFFPRGARAAEERSNPVWEEKVFRAGEVYRFPEKIDLEHKGFSMRMRVEGNFRREDSWFAVLLTNGPSSRIGEYGGIDLQFKPVSGQAAAAGSMPATLSLYTLGTAEGGSSASAVAAIEASDIPERETPYEFNVSIFLQDGTWIVNYGIDTYTYTWNYAGLDLSLLDASLIFGGEDAAISDMRVVVSSFGEASASGMFLHAAQANEVEGGVRIRELSKRQGKVVYPVALSAERDISVKFKINGAPGYLVNDNADAWMAVSLTSSPNAALPGSATFSTILRAHEDMRNGVKHIGGFFFFNGKDMGGFDQGVNTRTSAEFNELLYRIRGGTVTVMLMGETARTKSVTVGAGAFPEGKAYLSFAFHDNLSASIIERNEFGEETGRIPDPDVSYWDVTIGEIVEYGAPSIPLDGRRMNLNGGFVHIPVDLYGGAVSSLEYETGKGFSVLPQNAYALSQANGKTEIVLSPAFTALLGEGTHTFRLHSTHPVADHNGLCTEFSITFVHAEQAAVAVKQGVYDATRYNDVKYSFVLHDDAFVSLQGYGITAGDYFYNPVTGNLYLKREFCKNLTAGEYAFRAQFDFTEEEISLTVQKGGIGENPKAGASPALVIALSVTGGALALGAAFIVLYAVKRRKKKI